MLITFGNARLGAWLPNPRFIRGETPDSVRRFPRVGLSYLYKEFFGIHDPAEPYVYVSDGGHWENTGLVELLRHSMPREVVCVDADPGQPGSVHQISQALDLAKLECDVDVFMDLEPVRGFAEHEGGPVFAQRSVNLGLMRREESWGVLWHCKPVLTRSTPAPLVSHREIDPKFPHTSTVDQFFDTATYVAYRDLGRHNAEEIKKARDWLGRFLDAYATPEAVSTSGDDGSSAAYGWVAGAFVHLLHQVPELERPRLLADVIAALGEQVRNVAG